MTDPDLVSECNFAIENLVSDPNRSIATYAITTLLKVQDLAQPLSSSLLILQ
jgi:coatomer protein complex subunit gamma